MHAFLITGGSKDTRDTYIAESVKSWAVHTSDIHTISPDPLSIGIDTIRKIIPQLVLKPIASDVSVLVIRAADSMTIEAQNALLKTLEEPPRSVKILIESSTPDALLPTIISRCHRVSLGADHDAQQTADFYEMYKNVRNAGEWLRCVDSLIKNGHKPEDIILSLLTHISLHIRTQKDSFLYRACLTAHTYAESHVNPKSTLDSLWLSTSGQQS